MKCKICGARLRKEGDICKSCYEEYCKEEELINDVEEVHVMQSKYLSKYQLTQYFDGYVISFLIILVCIAYGYIFFSLLALILTIIGIVITLKYEKKKAENTNCTFYNKKVELNYNGNKKTLSYSNIKDVVYSQNFFQKIFKLADFHFYPKKGTYVLNGFSIKNVENFKEELEKIAEILD